MDYQQPLSILKHFTDNKINATGRSWIKRVFSPYCSIVDTEDRGSDLMSSKRVVSIMQTAPGWQEDEGISGLIESLFGDTIYDLAECFAFHGSAIGERLLLKDRWKDSVAGGIKRRYDMSCTPGTVNCCPGSFYAPVLFHRFSDKDFSIKRASCVKYRGLPKGTGVLIDADFLFICILDVLIETSRSCCFDEGWEQIKTTVRLAHSLRDDKAIIYTGIDNMPGTAMF